MRLVMLGTGPFAVPTLEALAASPHEVAHVITRPPRGRDPQASPLQRMGESLGLPVWSPESVNLPDSQMRLKSFAADLLVVCDYGEILKSETLAVTRLGGINLHGSLLPKFRGAAPVQWAILRGEAETGNSVIQMTPGLDAGPCLGQQRTPIDPDEDAATLEARLAKMGAELVIEVVEQLATGTTQTNSTRCRERFQSTAPQKGTRRNRLVAPCHRNQQPSPRRPPLAPRVHLLASTRRTATSPQHRPGEGRFSGPGCRRTHPRHHPPHRPRADHRHRRRHPRAPRTPTRRQTLHVRQRIPPRQPRPSRRSTRPRIAYRTRANSPSLAAAAARYH